MFLRFSSISEIFSFRESENDVILIWSTSIDLCGFSHLALVSLSIMPFVVLNEKKLAFLSSNLVQTSVTNPNTYIHSFKDLHMPISKGIIC